MGGDKKQSGNSLSEPHCFCISQVYQFREGVIDVGEGYGGILDLLFVPLYAYTAGDVAAIESAVHSGNVLQHF